MHFITGLDKSSATQSATRDFAAGERSVDEEGSHQDQENDECARDIFRGGDEPGVSRLMLGVIHCGLVVRRRMIGHCAPRSSYLDCIIRSQHCLIPEEGAIAMQGTAIHALTLSHLSNGQTSLLPSVERTETGLSQRPGLPGGKFRTLEPLDQRFEPAMEIEFRIKMEEHTAQAHSGAVHEQELARDGH